MAALNDVRQTITIETKLTGADEAKAKLNAIAAAQDGVSVSSAALTKAQLGVGNQLERLVQRIDPVARATRDLQKAQDLVARAMQQGVQGDYSSVLTTLQSRLDQARKANDNFSQSTGLAAHQVGNLRSQLFDVFTSLQGGASPFTVLSQQGPQIYEALAGGRGVAGGLKAAAVSASGVVASITPAIAVIGGVTAAALAGAAAYARFASNQKEVALGLAGAGRASGTSVSQINRVADASNIPGVSAQSVRELSIEFARTGKIGAEMYGDLSRFTKDYATLTGTDLTQAGQEVASAFASQSQGALKLNETVGGLSGTTYQLIQRLEAQGDRLGAQRAMMAAFSDATKAAAENTSTLARAWNGFKAGVSNGIDFVGKQVAIAVDGGSDLQEQLATAQKQLQSAKTRQGMLPLALSGLGDYDVSRSQERVEELTKAIERNKASTQEAVDAQKTLAGAKAIEALVPGAGDLRQLETFRSTLQQALDTGKAVTGTEDALKRVNELLKAGGTEAYNLMRSAKEAFSTATLLPFQQGIERINQRYAELLATAPSGSVAGLKAAREMEIGASRVTAINNPIRDANLSLNEQIATLKIQRDSFMSSTEAAAAMAAKQDLINGYIRAGVTDWQNYTGAIDAYATSAGKVAAANENLQKTQQNVVQGMDEVRSSSQSMLSGIFSDARQGKNPMQGILSSMGRMTDQFVDRMISKPLMESAFGAMGKPGGGMFGDDLSKMFGNVGAITTPMATVTASVVNVNGAGVGGIGTAGIAADGGRLPLGGTVPISPVQSFPLGPPGSQAVQSLSTVAGSMGKYAQAIKDIESGGGNYGALGPVTRSGDRAYGAYQVMGANVPSWTKSALGHSLTPAEFLKDKAAQDAVFNNKFGGYVDKFGPQGAAQAWFGGPGSVGKGGAGRDILGTSGNGYVDKFNQSLLRQGGAADQATQSITTLSDKLTDMPDATNGFAQSLTQLGNQLQQPAGGGAGGFNIGSMFSAGPGSASMIDAGGASWSANGNVMTSRGPMPLNRYAMGGIATSPQVSIFGEGRMNEAYVPLPDGRSIPVSMKVPTMPANTNAAAMGGGVTIHQAPISVSAAQGYTPEQIAAEIRKANAETLRHVERHAHSMTDASRRKYG